MKLLETHLLISDNQTAIKNEDGFTDGTMLGVIELLGLEVAIHKVSPVIQSVAKHFFRHNFSEKDLPSRQTILRIYNEGQNLI